MELCGIVCGPWKFQLMLVDLLADVPELPGMEVEVDRRWNLPVYTLENVYPSRIPELSMDRYYLATQVIYERIRDRGKLGSQHRPFVTHTHARTPPHKPTTDISQHPATQFHHNGIQSTSIPSTQILFHSSRKPRQNLLHTKSKIILNATEFNQKKETFYF